MGKIIFVSNNILLRWKVNKLSPSCSIFDDSIVIFQFKEEEIKDEILYTIGEINPIRIWHTEDIVYMTYRVTDIVRYIAASKRLNIILIKTIMESDYHELRTVMIWSENIDTMIDLEDVPLDFRDIDQYIYNSDEDRIATYGSIVTIDAGDELEYMKNIHSLYYKIKTNQANYVMVFNRIFYIPFKIEVADESTQLAVDLFKRIVPELYNFSGSDNKTSFYIMGNVDAYISLIKSKCNIENTIQKNIIQQIEEILNIYNIIY